jgi:hypothetical protein
MEQPEAAHGNSDLQKELAEVLRQRVAISAVLRAIANSPHDLQPIFDTIIDSAVHLCRAKRGTFRLSEEIGFRPHLPNGKIAGGAAYLTTTSCSTFLSGTGKLTPGCIR